MKQVLDPKKTAVSMHKWVNSHNDKLSYEERAERIRGGVYLTAKCILKDFIRAYAEGKTKGGFYDTSTSLIAAYTQQSRHTIIRHIRKLREIGFITKLKRDHTWSNNYQLQIMTGFLEYIREAVSQMRDSGTRVSESAATQIAENALNKLYANPTDMFSHIAKSFQSPTKMKFDSG